MLKTQKRLLAAGAAALVLITALLCIFTAVTVNADSPEWDGTTASSFAGGTGTSDDPYLIASAEQLAYLAEQVNSGTTTFEGEYIKLTDNIVLNNSIGSSSKKWTPIGGANPFKGTFDGTGYTVKGVYINNSDSYQGLFGSSGGTIKNVNVTGSITGGEDVGGVCGSNGEYVGSDSYYGNIENCSFSGTVRGSEDVGGICGFNFAYVTDYSTVVNCRNEGAVSSSGDYVGGICGDSYGKILLCCNTGLISGDNDRIGGICGYNGDGLIEKCYNTGSVSGQSSFVGGVCGENNSGTIKNTYNTGNVKGDNYVGGVCGVNAGTTENSFSSCYVSGSNYVGGVCGYNQRTVTNCYYNKNLVLQDNGNGTGKTTAELCTLSGMGFDSGIWTAGSCELMTIDSDGLGTISSYTLPKLSEFGTSAVTGSDLKLYNIGTAENENWVVCTPIYTAQQLQAINDSLVGAYVLMNSIDVSVLTETSEGNWTAIGSSSAPFSGIFEGNGYTVSGIKINKPDDDYQGLFGYSTGIIRNVKTANGSITGYKDVGGVCGYNEGTVENCSNTCMVNGGSHVGGVCGNNKGTVENCSNTCTVNGESYVGGVCGLSGDFSFTNNSIERIGVIKNSVNEADVSGTSFVGGICGSNIGTIDSCTNKNSSKKVSAAEVSEECAAGGICGTNGGVVFNSYNEAEVYGDSYAVGGVCGSNTKFSYWVLNYPGFIQNCYNTGFVWGNNTRIGGVCGYNLGDMESCYNLGDVKSDTIYAGGVCGANGGMIDLSGNGNYQELNGTIKDCYSAGKLIHTNPNYDKNVGGVCGLVYNSTSTITNCWYNKDLCAYGGTGAEGEYDADTDDAKGLTTPEMTCGEALTKMGFDTAVWNKKSNDKDNLIAYYPDLASIDSDAPSIGYETKLDFALSDGCTFVYGGELSFDISALVKFEGMNDFSADDTALTRGHGLIVVSFGDTELCSDEISDNTVATVTYDDAAKLLSPVAGNTLTLSYDGTYSDFLKTDNTKTVSVGSVVSLTHIPAVAADCENDGNIEYWTGVLDGVTYYFSNEAGTAAITEADTVIPATGHNWDRNYSYDEHDHWHKCLNENCPITDNSQKDGYGEHYSAAPATEDTDEVCAVCGYVITPALNHVHKNNLTAVDKVPETCTTNGTKAHYKCSCGKLFADDQAETEVTAEELVIAAHHTWSNDWSSDNDENHYHLCTVCGEKTDIAAHSYDSGVITIEPTNETEGEKTYTCSVCDHQKKESVPKLGHIHTPSEEYSKDETGHWKTCSGCDEKLDFAKHTFGEWKITTAATAEKDGEKTRVCTVCGYTETAIEPKPEPKPVVNYPISVSGKVTLDKPSAAAGETVNVRTDFGYDIIVTASNGQRIAQITEKGSFTMPACKVYVNVVQNDTFALMSNAWNNSYVYSYDSDMNKIKVNSTKNRGVIVVNLGEEYAGKSFTIYSGRKNTDVKITEGVLNSNGAYKFEVTDGKNYTLVVED